MEALTGEEREVLKDALSEEDALAGVSGTIRAGVD